MCEEEERGKVVVGSRLRRMASAVECSAMPLQFFIRNYAHDDGNYNPHLLPPPPPPPSRFMRWPCSRVYFPSCKLLSKCSPFFAPMRFRKAINALSSINSLAARVVVHHFLLHIYLLPRRVSAFSHHDRGSSHPHRLLRRQVCVCFTPRTIFLFFILRCSASL